MAGASWDVSLLLPGFPLALEGEPLCFMDHGKATGVHFAAVMCLSPQSPWQRCPAEWRGNLPPTLEQKGMGPSLTAGLNPETAPDTLLPVIALPGWLRRWQSTQWQEILLFQSLITLNFNTVETILYPSIRNAE